MFLSHALQQVAKIMLPFACFIFLLNKEIKTIVLVSIAFLLHVLWCQHLTFSNDNVSPCYFLVSFTDEFDSYIVVSFINATLVLSIGETVEEVTDSGFLGTTPTLSCSQLGEDALLQVLGSC